MRKGLVVFFAALALVSVLGAGFPNTAPNTGRIGILDQPSLGRPAVISGTVDVWDPKTGDFITPYAPYHRNAR